MRITELFSICPAALIISYHNPSSMSWLRKVVKFGTSVYKDLCDDITYLAMHALKKETFWEKCSLSYGVFRLFRAEAVLALLS